MSDTDHWKHGAAVAIHDSEKWMAMQGLRLSRQFKAELAQALKLHQAIVDRLERFLTVAEFGDPILAGAWQSPSYFPDGSAPLTSVISLPSMQRHGDIEAPLRRLGDLLGHTTKALTVTVGGADRETCLMWHDEDVERIDITDERTFIDLFERLRWASDDVVRRRFFEINDAIRAGRVPEPPTYVWPEK